MFSSVPLLTSTSSSIPSPSVSPGLFNGSVPLVTSSPFVTPSPSQSAASHAALGVASWFATIKLQAFVGSVPSINSCAYVTPSPSQSVVACGIQFGSALG